MSRLVKLLILSFVVLTATFAVQAQKIPDHKCGKNVVHIPPGTKTEKRPDGGLTLTLPDGWKFLQNKGNNNWAATQLAVVRCTCNSGPGGCSPAAFGGQVACVMTSCSACTMSGDGLYAFSEQEPPVSFATKAEAASLPQATNELMSIPQVIRAISNFQSQLGIQPADVKDKLALVKVYNRLIALEIPSSALLPKQNSAVGNAAMAMAASQVVTIPNIGAISCTCNSGGSCPKGGSLGAHWCDATNCQSCTMSGY